MEPRHVCTHVRTHAHTVLMRCYGSLLCLIITSQAQVFCFVFSCVLKMLIISQRQATCTLQYYLYPQRSQTGSPCIKVNLIPGIIVFCVHLTIFVGIITCLLWWGCYGLCLEVRGCLYRSWYQPSAVWDQTQIVRFGGGTLTHKPSLWPHI